MNDISKFDRKRRSFLKLSGLLGLGAFSSCLLPPASAEAVLFGKREYKVSRTELTMGTYVSMTVIHSSRDAAEQAIGEAFAEIDKLNLLLTRFNESSPLGVLNKGGRLDTVPSEIDLLVQRSLYYHDITGGAFDITVKPVLDLYKLAFEQSRIPGDAEIEHAMLSVGVDKLLLRDGRMEFAADNMGVTLDGIAKGYIVDRASAILKAKGMKNHLVNGGGDIRTAGTAKGGKPWSIGIQDPAAKDKLLDVIHLQDGAVATSGNYEVYYDREKMFHHIVDAKNGFSPQLASSVTVTAATVADADALSTAVFVMGPEQGRTFINGTATSECMILDRKMGRTVSAHWRA